MSDKPSGTYVIDSEYNIVSFNSTAHELYPQLKRGQKCHKCLMGLDEPCEVCPVLNHICGPHVYFDPIRHIHESVDAVEMELADGSLGHALIFATVGERERFAHMLPNNEEEFNSLYNKEIHDALTGGPNRLGFIRKAEELILSSGASDYVVLFFNVRNFKAINEVFGSEGGDELLKYLYRNMTAYPQGPLVVARLEADHFAWLMRRDNLDIDLLNESLEVEWSTKGKTLQLHLHCGIYYPEDNVTSVSSMIDRANLARQQTEGEHVYHAGIFDPKTCADYVDEADVLSEFQRGILNHEFQVYYQPVVNSITGRVVSAEALLRWVHPTKGIVSPGLFIPVLEKNGYITKLDTYVMETVFDTLDKRERQGEPTVPVSINLSWLDFCDENLVRVLFKRLEELDSSAAMVNLELTETSFAALEQNRSDLLSMLRSHGAKILLDDFGSGYSSFGMIRDYDFDVLKIDMTFVRQLESNSKVRNIITAIIEMCHQIGLAVVAEGVETEGQLGFLRNVDCDLIQGYYYSKPLCEKDFFEYLTTHTDEEERTDDITRFVASTNDHQMVEHLIQALDNTGQFVQICDPRTYRMVFANAATRALSGHPDEPYIGMPCYQYMLGLDAPCAHCPMKQMDGEDVKEVEVDDGVHVFALRACYMNWSGLRVFGEFGRDVTSSHRERQRYDTQIAAILKSVPKGQGIFHVDVTEDQWISSNGNAQAARDMQDMPDVDTLVRRIGSFVPTPKDQKKFFDTFCRTELLNAYSAGRREISLDTQSYYDDNSIRWSRVTARLVKNPETKSIECVLYGVDISEEHERMIRMESELEQARAKYNKADRDRRTDFLTGLSNRLELFDRLRDTIAGTAPTITSMFMVDIDDFKILNDRFGHSAGDECLKSIGKALAIYGEQHNMLFFRYGGEEFLGMGFDRRTAPAQAAKDILALVQGLHIVHDNKDLSVTASIGYTTNNSRFERMVDLADRAMYLAKRRGKNRIVCNEDRK